MTPRLMCQLHVLGRQHIQMLSHISTGEQKRKQFTLQCHGLLYLERSGKGSPTMAQEYGIFLSLGNAQRLLYRFLVLGYYASMTPILHHHRQHLPQVALCKTSACQLVHLEVPLRFLQFFPIEENTRTADGWVAAGGEALY